MTNLGPYLQTLLSLLKSLPFSKVGFNFLDFLIFFIFIFYAIEGYSIGFILASFDFISFIFSFVLGLKFYSFFSDLLVSQFSIPQGFANAIGFFIIVFVSEITINIFLRRLVKYFPKHKVFQFFNKYFGFIPGLLSAALLLSFLLTLVISLPFSPILKNSISSSKISNLLLFNTQFLEKKINAVFGGAISETLNFLTIEPESNEFVALNFKTQGSKVDEVAEKKMLEMLNKERVSRGLGALSMDDTLRAVARLHSQDMLARGYFSHYSPDGTSPFDRMASFHITFTFAGENLALAPNVELAMQGLMNSPGHKANILSPDFRKVGIGVLDGGIYGEMFSQEFTD